MITAEDITNNLRLPGQYYDQETGLYYNLNRYYDPVAGRYLRTDPQGDGLNLYAYCFSNPVNWIDPRGLCAVKKVWGELSQALSPSEAYGAEIRIGVDIGLKEWEEFDYSIQSRETGYVRVTMRYRSAKGSDIISSIIGLLGLAYGVETSPFGYHERKVYKEVEYAKYRVYKITDTRTQVSRERLVKIKGSEGPVIENMGLPIYQDIQPGKAGRGQDYSFVTTHDFFEKDLETVIQSTIPGTVNRPVGFY